MHSEWCNQVYIPGICWTHLRCRANYTFWFLHNTRGQAWCFYHGGHRISIKDMLKQLKIELNLTPFMEGRKQVPVEEVQKGQNIVERAIGRLKNFGILSGTNPLSLSQLTNQIVHVSAFLCNFQLALITSSQGTAESDVTDYIEGLTSSDSDDYSDYENMPSQSGCTCMYYIQCMHVYSLDVRI